MNAVELLMRRKNVAAFIAADPVSIAFSRPGEPVDDGVGGRKTSSPSTVPSQMARIVHNTRRYKNGLVNSEAGDIPLTDYLLIGKHTLDVEVNDEFQWDGLDGMKTYKITGVHPFRQESVLCSIDFKGPHNHSVPAVP